MSTQKPSAAKAAEPVDFDEPAEITGEELSALQSITNAEVNMQIATARKYPRSITRFRQELQEMATQDPKLAESMYYCLPRGKDRDTGKPKFIEGPSVRLAEAAHAAWGNMRSGARPLLADATHITCQGFAHDLERNNFVAFEVKRRITGTDGRRFNEDMITVTGAAGSKIAWRNSIFGVIPRMYINEAYKKAKATAAGALKSIVEAKAEALAWWTELGGSKEDLLSLFQRPGMDDISLDDLVRLKGVRTAVEESDNEADFFAALLRDIRETASREVRTTGLSAEAILQGRATGKDEPAGKPNKSEKAKAPEPEPEKRPEPAKAEPPIDPVISQQVDEALATKAEEKKPEPAKPAPSDATAATARSLFG